MLRRLRSAPAALSVSVLLCALPAVPGQDDQAPEAGAVSLAEETAPNDESPWLTLRGTDDSALGAGRHVVFVTGDEEYRSEEGMPQIARILAHRHGFDCTVLFAVDPETGAFDPNHQEHIPGLEALDDADLMVVFTRFRDLPDEQMAHFVDYVESGRPLLGLRTATHAFDIREDSTYRRWSWRNPEWEGGFGRQVLGETWIAHHGGHGSESTRGRIPEDAAEHAILRGIDDGAVWDPSDVYRVRLPLPEGCETLLFGEVVAGMSPTDDAVEGPKNDPMMPVAWVRERTVEAAEAPQRVFATTIGASQAFAQEASRRLVVNACLWAMGLDDRISADLDVRLVGDYQPTRFGFRRPKKD